MPVFLPRQPCIAQLIPLLVSQVIRPLKRPLFPFFPLRSLPLVAPFPFFRSPYVSFPGYCYPSISFCFPCVFFRFPFLFFTRFCWVFVGIFAPFCAVPVLHMQVFHGFLRGVCQLRHSQHRFLPPHRKIFTLTPVSAASYGVFHPHSHFPPRVPIHFFGIFQPFRPVFIFMRRIFPLRGI